MSIEHMPLLNACLNATATVLLLAGYIMIKKGRRETHTKLMIGALVFSAAFLTSYVIYHYHAGSTPYPHQGWTRPLYFLILIPHIILATVMVPFIIAMVIFAVLRKFERHKRLARWVWPVWIYVSISGVIVYLMLYQL